MTLAVSLLLLALPAADLWLARALYVPGAGFVYGEDPPVQWIYHGVPWIVWALSLVLLTALVWAAAAGGAEARTWRGRCAFAILALALGPGLLSHTLFKDRWGRPRPVQVREFGGAWDFVPAPLPGGACRHNCSFVSGHAAAGFYLITGAWLWPRRRRAWLLAGLGAGGIVGLARMAQGAHFLSDVLGSAVVVWGTNMALNAVFVRRGWLA